MSKLGGLGILTKVKFLCLRSKVYGRKNNEKVQYLIDMINNKDIKDKLRLAICMSQSQWSGLI